VSRNVHPFCCIQNLRLSFFVKCVTIASSKNKSLVLERDFKNMLKSLMFSLFVWCLVGVSNVFAVSTTVVISQTFSGSGSATGTWNRDYVELHNISGTTQSLDGLALQYGSATGQFGSAATLIYSFPAGITLTAGQYYLIQLSNATTGLNTLPIAADQNTTNINMAGASGKIALTNTAVALGCGATATPCTLPDARIIDSVAYGVSNNGEGGTTVNGGAALTVTQSAIRKFSGCVETDNNNTDFFVNTFAAVPVNTLRNSATAVVNCTVTAADGSINGRILSASGRGIGNVRVTLQSVATGEVRYVRTNPFGYYRFSELETGEDYVLSVASKRYTFAQSSVVVNLNENLEGLNFIAEQ
jgi:Lamin Tail Domain/Carboxypeptidase regulatory-like domain